MNITVNTNNRNNKKKVTVFFSEGGGGHRSVAKSIKDTLEPHYEVELIVPIGGFLKNLDPIKTWTRGRFSGESLYNIFLQKRLFGLVRIYGYFGQLLSSLKKRGITKRTIKFLKESQSDFLISDFPYFNNSFLEAAETLNIPFMIVVCDLYTKHYLHGIQDPTYPKFYDTIFFDHPLPKSTVAGHGIKEDHILCMGLPVRLDFYQEKNRVEILKSLEIQEGKPIIFILMGYFGSRSGLEYFKMIQKNIKTPVHVVIVLGKNTKINQLFEEIKLDTPDHITYTKIDFTDKVSDIFFVADIVISKSGGLSTSEAIYMKKPIIIDRTKKPLYWEKMVGDFVESLQIGYNARSYKKAIGVVNDWITSPEKLELIKENYKSIPNIQFGSFIFNTVNQIFEKFPPSQPSLEEQEKISF